MAGDRFQQQLARPTLANIRPDDYVTPFQRRSQQVVETRAKNNIKSLADLTQTLTGDTGSHIDRLNRMDAGRGVSRSASQRMFEDR